MALTQWADALRSSPYFKYGVEEHNNWKNNRPLGDLASLDGVFWHHDASPEGPSPGDVGWLISAYNARQPSAQIIIGYDGTWHFVGSGRAYHSGTVRGPLDWSNTVGIETDHTSYEVMSPRLKDSIETGLAVICVLEGRDAGFVTFHKIEARPLTRKQDPYFGGDALDTSKWEGELATERGIIQQHISNIGGGQTSTPTPDDDEDDEMYHTYQPNEGPDSGGIWVACPGFFEPLPSTEYYNALVNSGAAKEVKVIGRREFDVIRDSYRRFGPMQATTVSFVSQTPYTVLDAIRWADKNAFDAANKIADAAPKS